MGFVKEGVGCGGGYTVVGCFGGEDGRKDGGEGGFGDGSLLLVVVAV